MSHDSDDLCFAGAVEQARKICDGEVTARQLAEATLDRIERINPIINAYRVVCTERALADADRADAELAAGAFKPMLGVPVAIKDTVDVEGETTTWGTGANGTAASADAPIVAALRDAGAVIIGKTTCSELAAWPVTETETWGATRNPWDIEFSPGGSSGGSAAAVAAGLCGVALGSDGLGSIRAPASFTGLFGLKPQRNRVWHDPADWHGLAVNGPLSRSVADAALFLDATSVKRPALPFTKAIDTKPTALRIAVAWRSLAKFPMTARLGIDQRNAVEKTIELLGELGHTVITHELEFSRRASSNVIVRYLAGVAESSAALDDPDRLSSRTRALAKLGRRISQRRLGRALENEAAIARAMNRVFDHADVVLTPGALQPPLRVGELERKGTLRAFDASGRIIPHYGPWNVIGQPAATLPAGFDQNGLPVSIHIAGRPHDEPTLLALAAQLETARPWAHHRPTIARHPNEEARQDPSDSTQN